MLCLLNHILTRPLINLQNRPSNSVLTL
ncbi:MAG: hypothetical protein ACD_45C00484G0005, partial [uncultured bacterium]